MTQLLSSHALCTRLSETVLATLKPLTAGRNRYGLLDFPEHWNIGDSAIWAGEIALLNRLFARGPDHVSHHRHDPNEPGRVLGEDRILFLHGGGNFGDIWTTYHSYRAAVIRRHPHHRIIQLPQSIQFNDVSNIEETKRVLGSHPDYHLMVRDHESYALATQYFNCPVYLTPDSAFGIDMSQVSRVIQSEGILGLLRTDKEARSDAKEGCRYFEKCLIGDWNKLPKPVVFGDKVMRRLFRSPILGGVQGLRTAVFNAMATARVNLGFAQLDRAEVVVTDRLHGHIMSTLLGKPHVVIDNYYGKIARFIDAFGKDDATLQASTYAEAREMADDLLNRIQLLR
ncbi:MAG: polysaccharide pyruvyl transferase family protein [Paracoccaceae bacterium]